MFAGIFTRIKSSFRWLLRHFLILIGRILGFILFDLTIIGREHLVETKHRPLIVIANHFSWFDPAILSLYLPFPPAFLVATETFNRKAAATIIRLFDGIPIWRGQVDRQALHKAHQTLRQGTALGIFPEGGMNPDNAERIARGETIPELRGHTARRSGALVRPRSGSALLAVQSSARILPVALVGTEHILDNLSRFRRTPVTMTIGPVFGPLTVTEGLRGPERRVVLDQLAEEMMQKIARLMPPARRGPYADADLGD
jgi:1-acyl-sn-glycerol-3-phosphate acyltransferase